MTHSALLYIVALWGGTTSVLADDAGLLPHVQVSEVCQQIAASTSNASEVYDILSLQYIEDTSHWASSSSQVAACSFEPGTAEDVGKALRILGQTQIPFAVKCGSHTLNPGFLSTSGVQIVISRFSEVSYDPTTQTVTVGAGLIWDDVYQALEPYGVNVVGARSTSVGVAGLTLGGGYSWLTNQYGLTIDTVEAFELVLPNGTVTDVTETTSPDLFFALKGGLNNFGIVTEFTLKAFPQTQVLGGLITYTEDVLDQVSVAMANFVANNDDLKAAIIISYNFVLIEPGVTQILSYEGPSQPGVFDEFLVIPSFILVILAVGTFQSDLWHTASALLVNLYDGTNYFTAEPLTRVEPFLPSLFSHNTTPSASPPSRTTPFFPIEIYFAWLLPTSDKVFQDAVRTSAGTLKTHAIKDGRTEVADAFLYSNFVIFDTPLADLYGANLPRLQAIKAMIDPDNVMGLAGGFKL